jgi:6-pyruvoyltetrahydropterin/6-carboxytetrahydropterin synthase
MEHQVAVYRKEHFNAAHKLYCADWTDEENKRVFGACSKLKLKHSESSV